MENDKDPEQSTLKDFKSVQPQEHELANLYREFIVFTQKLINSKEIDATEIEKKIDRIVTAFMEKPFNELLLYMYASSKDNYITAHIVNNVILAIGFANGLGLKKEEIHEVGLVAFCHDFGMMEYTDLFQKALQLTPSENELIRHHPLKSAEMFKPFFSEKVISGILDIHECVGGGGYPNGKTGVEITLLAKIVSICDVYEALSHPRSFRKEFIPYETIKTIIKKKDIIFDTRVVKKFLEFMSIYPIGSLVYLNTEETGIVIESNLGHPTRSIIRVLLNAKREVDQSGKIINLMNDPMVHITGPVKANEEQEILHFLKPRGEFDI
jgi:HD-GYP domain-containing protein (c-di-GMP phosphodiesterase class II)